MLINCSLNQIQFNVCSSYVSFIFGRQHDIIFGCLKKIKIGRVKKQQHKKNNIKQLKCHVQFFFCFYCCLSHIQLSSQKKKYWETTETRKTEGKKKKKKFSLSLIIHTLYVIFFLLAFE